MVCSRRDGRHPRCPSAGTPRILHRPLATFVKIYSHIYPAARALCKASEGQFRYSPFRLRWPNRREGSHDSMARRIRFGGLRICALRDWRGDHASAAVTTSLLSRSIRRPPVGGPLCEQSFACARNRGPSVISGQCNQFGRDRGLSCWSSGSRAGALSRPSPSRRPDLYTVRVVRRVPESWFGEYERAPLREPSYCGAKQHHTVQGLVRQQVAGLLADHPDPVSFPHADCDLYSSRVLSRAARGAMGPAAET